jgi:hypothetical protein
MQCQERMTFPPKPDGATEPHYLRHDRAEPPIGLSYRLKDYENRPSICLSVCPYQICGCAKSQVQKCTAQDITGEDGGWYLM